jgi:hypothetical protein
MSTATLNVWITETGDPCHIVGSHPGSDREWFVTIVDCEGKPLVWCGRKYVFIPARCGHLEIEIPPGCYAVFAGHGSGHSGVAPFGNSLTHIQVVRANCGDHVCVTLFSPDLHFCGTWFAHALQTQAIAVAAAGGDPKAVKAAVGAIETVLAGIKPAPFTAGLEAFKNGPSREDAE